MHKSSLGWIGSMMVVAAVGCGGGGGAKGSGSVAESPSSTSVVPGLSKLGHFSSADGMVRLVVDRTGEKMKVRLDGDKDVIELTPEEVRHRSNGQLIGYALIAPDGKRRLFLGVGGDLTYIKDERDELPLVRDGEATALGEPTMKGPPPPPKPPEKSAHQVIAEKLAAISVTKKFPQFKPEDAGNFAKVAEAWNLATAEMLMHCSDRCGAWYAPYPVPQGGGNGKGGLGFVEESKMPQGPATEREKKAPLSKFNGWLRPNYEFGDWTHQVVKSSWLTIYQFEFRKLQPKTPVLVWDVENDDVILVTADGSRYWDSPADNNGRPHLDPGVPQVGEWPAPVRNNLLFREHVAELGKAGLVDKKAADEIESIHSKWSECAQKVFVPAQKEIEGNLSAGNVQFFAAKNRNQIALRKYNDKAFVDCGAKKAEQLLVDIITKRDKEQLALFEKNKKHVPTIAK